MIDTTPLTTAYDNLRNYLAEVELYASTPTAPFDRTRLAELFTAYYDAEAEVLRAAAARDAAEKAAEAASEAASEAAAGQTAVARDELAKGLGYADYAAMRQAAAAGKTILEGGMLRTGLIDTDHLVAKQVDVLHGSSRTTILPGEGLKLLENNVVTATFTGEQIASVADVVPQIPSVALREQHATVDVLLGSAKGKLVMADAAVPHLSQPLTVEIPAITLHALIRCTHIGYEPTGLRGFLTLRINGEARQHYFETGRFERSEVVVGEDAYGGPIMEPKYDLEQHVRFLCPGQTIPVPAQGSGSASTPVEIAFEYNSDGQISTGELWDVRFFAKIGDNPVTSAPVTDYLRIGGATFNAAFYGNGLVFSKSTDQYVGLCSTSGGTELIARSGKYGLKVDRNGVSHLADNGEWDNSMVLGAGHIDTTGQVNRQTGVKKFYGRRESKGIISSPTISGIWTISLWPRSAIRP